MFKNKLLSDVFFLGVFQISNYIFPFVTIPIVYRALGPDKIGLVNYIGAFMVYFIVFVSYSFDLTGVRRYMNGGKNDLSILFSKIFTAQFYLFLFVLLFFLPTLFFHPVLKNNLIVSLLFFSLCLQSLFSQNWLFQAQQKLKFISIINFIGKLLSVISIILFIRTKSDYVVYVAATTIFPVLISIVTFFISISKFNITFKPATFSDVIKLIWQDKSIFFSNVVISLYTSTSTVILGSFHSSTTVGYYSSSQKIIDIARSVVMLPISQVLFPYVAEVFSKDRKLALEKVQKILPVFSIITLSSFIAIAGLGPFVVRLFFGERFLPSILLLEILNFGLFSVFYGVFFGSIVMLNLHLDKLYFKITFFGAIFSLLLSFFFVPSYGAVATSIVWSVTEVCITIVQVVVLYKNGFNVFKFNFFNPKSIIESIKTLNK